MKKQLALLALAFGTVAGAQNAPAPDLWAGAWKLDISQSKLHDTPKSAVVTIQPADEARTKIAYTVHMIAADGTTMHETYDGKSDGKPYPLMINGKEASMVSYTRTSNVVTTSTGSSKDGRNTTATITMSPEGKTITVETHVTDSKGTYDDKAVYEKSS